MCERRGSPGGRAVLYHADLSKLPFHPVRAVHEDETDNPQDDVHDDAGRDDGHALPDGLVAERARIVLVFFHLRFERVGKRGGRRIVRIRSATVAAGRGRSSACIGTSRAAAATAGPYSVGTRWLTVNPSADKT